MGRTREKSCLLRALSHYEHCSLQHVSISFCHHGGKLPTMFLELALRRLDLNLLLLFDAMSYGPTLPDAIAKDTMFIAKMLNAPSYLSLVNHWTTHFTTPTKAWENGLLALKKHFSLLNDRKIITYDRVDITHVFNVCKIIAPHLTSSRLVFDFLIIYLDQDSVFDNMDTSNLIPHLIKLLENIQATINS